MKARVLLVDDIPANLRALEAALRDLPCELVGVTSGAEALSILPIGGWAVLLIDAQMPEMDGYELARRVRAHPAAPDLPIIFVTAQNVTDDDLHRAYGSGAVDFLWKPINLSVLSSKVQVFLDLYAGRERLAREVAAHEATMRELEAFSYTVSHDLRAPLRSIDGFTRIVLDQHGDGLDPEGKAHLERVVAAAARMNALISDLLDLARVGQMELRRTDVDLSKLARDAIDRLRANDPSRVVDVDVAPNLHANADARLCAVVIDNLVANAWKFTATRELARIEVGKRDEDGAFFVRDDGVGFDMQHAKKLFKTFERLHSSAEFEGTGIGLATVRRIVERHGGAVSAEARPGAGATFTFRFEPRRE